MYSRTLGLVCYASVMVGLVVGLVAALLTHALLAGQSEANLVDGLHLVSQLCLSVSATTILVLHDRARRAPAIEVCDDEADSDETPPVGFYGMPGPRGRR
jgi:hypothetical protein